jgi:hypothetical protein
MASALGDRDPGERYINLSEWADNLLRTNNVPDNDWEDWTNEACNLMVDVWRDPDTVKQLETFVQNVRSRYRTQTNRELLVPCMYDAMVHTRDRLPSCVQNVQDPMSHGESYLLNAVSHMHVLASNADECPYKWKAAMERLALAFNEVVEACLQSRDATSMTPAVKQQLYNLMANAVKKCPQKHVSLLNKIFHESLRYKPSNWNRLAPVLRDLSYNAIQEYLHSVNLQLDAALIFIHDVLWYTQLNTKQKT